MEEGDGGELDLIVEERSLIEDGNLRKKYILESWRGVYFLKK